MLIDPERDEVTVDGREITPPARHIYVALNKPKGVIVSAADPGRRTTVFDLVSSAEAGSPRLFAVGRLDFESSGLILLTDDGDAAHRLMHPRHKVPKEYLAVVNGLPTERDLKALREGVELEDGLTQPAEVTLLGNALRVSELRIVIKEGRNRQVRRMLEAVGHPCRDLQRLAFGPIRLGRLREGGWRKLREAEVESLLSAAGMKSAGH